MFVVDVPHLDYLTLTTFNPVVAGKIHKWIADQARKCDYDKKRMQYTGNLFHHQEGTCFIGVGKQKGREHNLIQCSGMWADSLLAFSLPYLKRGYARCTRIDVQITIPHNHRHDAEYMQNLADVLRSRTNRPVSYLESFSGPAGSKLATVYVGSRQSDRFARIYEKMGLGEDIFLRFEVEYKSKRAEVVVDALAHDATRPGLILNEIDRISALALAEFRRRVDDAETFNPVVVKPEPATAKWLLEQVAPALDRYLNDHNMTQTEVVRDKLLRILNEPR